MTGRYNIKCVSASLGMRVRTDSWSQTGTNSICDTTGVTRNVFWYDVYLDNVAYYEEAKSYAERQEQRIRVLHGMTVLVSGSDRVKNCL